MYYNKCLIRGAISQNHLPTANTAKSASSVYIEDSGRLLITLQEVQHILLNGIRNYFRTSFSAHKYFVNVLKIISFFKASQDRIHTPLRLYFECLLQNIENK